MRAAMPGFIAKKLCPQLVIVSTHFNKYRAASKEVGTVLAQYDPQYCAMGLDEAFLDITDCVLKRHETEKQKDTCIDQSEQGTQSPVVRR